MKTAIVKEIDGYKLIKKFDKALIDAVETQSRVNKRLKETDEFNVFKKSTEKYYEALSKQREKDRIEELRKDVESKKEKLDAKIESMKDDLISYHNPAKNEVLLSDEEYESLKNKKESLKEDESLTIDGNVIKNLKGQGYFLKKNGEIKSFQIKKIGEDYPPGAKKDLSENEKEEFYRQENKRRIDSLASSQKDKEYQQEKQKIINKLSNRKIELELEGEPPQTSSQKAISEFQSELDSLKSLYGKSE